MKYIVDTHIFIWLIRSAENLNPQQLKVLKNTSNDIFVTNISFWEIALKYAKGKLDLFGYTPQELTQVAKDLNFKILNFDAQTMANSHQLMNVKKHKDPFDRLLIWHCIENNYTFISNDNKIGEYEKQGLKWI